MLAETFNHCNLTAIASAVFTTTKKSADKAEMMGTFNKHHL